MEMTAGAYRFVEMIVKLFDGSISDEEYEQLTELLRANPKARQYYIETALLESIFNSRRALGTELSTYLYEPPLDPQLWDALMREERNAEPVEIEKIVCKSRKPVGQRVNSEKYAPRSRRSAIITIMLSAAAVIMLVLSARFIPPRSPGFVASVSSQSIDAKWAHATGMIQTNQPLYVGPMRLLSGIAKLQFDSGAMVLIEGPADFTLEGNDQIYLGKGRLTASAPSYVIGFTVRTPNASVVDYGTDFGVLVQEGGWTEAHVFQGAVEIRQGSNVRVFDTSRRLTTGQAALARHDGIHSIDNRPQLFIADMPTTYDTKIGNLRPSLIWRHSPQGFRHFSGAPIASSLQGLGEDVEFERIQGIPGLDRFQALRLNGNDRYQIHVPGAKSGYSDSDGFGHIFWFKTDAVTEQDLLVDVAKREGYEYYRIISIDQDGRVVHSMRRTDRSGRNISIKSQRVIEAGQWYQAALVGVQNTKSLYINGRLEGHEELVSPYRLTSSMFYLGGAPLLENNDHPLGFVGQIGELIGFDRALSNEEIMHLYEAAYSTSAL